jgi:ankyrin repeat protein
LSTLCKPGGKLRETPLHIAARVKDGDRCALMLLKSGAGPNIKTDDGQTPVHVAAKHGNLVTLMLLLDDGGDPLCKSKVIINVVSCLCSLGILSCAHT